MAIISKRFPIVFYHVKCHNGDYEEFVNAANKNDIFHKNLRLYEYEIILDTLEETSTYVCGHFVKTKMEDIEPKYNVKTFKTEGMPLSDDEGIPAGTVWLYHKKTKVLFFQKTMFGVSANQFCEYFEHFTSTGQMYLSFVMSEEGFRKLAGMEHISKVEIAIKGLDKAHILKDVGDAKAVLSKMNDLKANTVKVELSKGNRAEGLSLDNTKKFVTDFFNTITNRDGDGEGHIKVTGRDEEDEKSSSIDLLISRYKKEIMIDINSESRLNTELHSLQKLNALKGIVNSAVKDLSRMIGS